MSKNIKNLQGLLAKLRREPHWVILAGSGLLLGLVSGGTSVSDTSGLLTLAARLAIALLIVLGLLYLCTRILQGTQEWLPAARQRKITLLETHSLGPRRALYLVRVGHQQFLLGATEHNLTLISEIIERTQQPASGMPTTNSEAIPIPFTTLLRQHLTNTHETQ
jgi:flagellar biosynthetic protein FliO